MPKKSNKKSSNNKGFSVWVFFGAAIGLLFLFIVLFFVKLYFYENSNSSAIIKYAAGPKISYGDPLIRDAKTVYPKVMSDDVRKGNTNSRVTIFYYCDLLSPLCSQQQEEIYKLLAFYTDDILRIVWKGTASTPVGLLAQQAAYCANAQGKFWEYQQEVFKNQSNIDIRFVEVLAEQLNLATDEFRTCLYEGQMEGKVYQNNFEAEDMGIDALPYFFIDNTPFRGFFSSQELSEIINEFL